MSRPTFGVDIDCLKCGEIHPADTSCNIEPVDQVWLRRADGWRGKQTRGLEFTSEDLCRSIGRPLNNKLIGAKIGEWQRLGYIRALEITTAQSRRRHNGTLRVWVML